MGHGVSFQQPLPHPVQVRLAYCLLPARQQEGTDVCLFSTKPSTQPEARSRRPPTPRLRSERVSSYSALQKSAPTIRTRNSLDKSQPASPRPGLPAVRLEVAEPLRGAAWRPQIKRKLWHPPRPRAASPFPELKPGSPRVLSHPSAPQMGPPLWYTPWSPWASAYPSGPPTQQPRCSLMEPGPVGGSRHPQNGVLTHPCHPLHIRTLQPLQPSSQDTQDTVTCYFLCLETPPITWPTPTLPSELSSKSFPPGSLPQPPPPPSINHPVYAAPSLPPAVLHAQCHAG